ncbi:MAG: S8 family serine peptidase [Candidatus Woesearchaeota archaeon]
MNRQGCLVVLLLVLLVSVLLVSFVAAADVEREVAQVLANDDLVDVIVVLNDESSLNVNSIDRKERIKNVQEDVLTNLKIKNKEVDGIRINSNNRVRGAMARESLNVDEEDYDLDLAHQYSIINGFSGKVTRAGLEKLKNDPQVKEVHLNRVLYTTLATSIPQINADDVWNLSVNGYNITGEGETVCVLDTGIDTDHPAFSGKILDEYCYCRVSDYGAGGCCPDTTTEDDSAEDGQGHGTHVSGTAAGNLSGYYGVAPDAKIVSIKVCNNAGQAACNEADVIAGIEWCTNNASLYNISVISMSLGGGGPYNDYCNDYVMTDVINTAVNNNITVSISSGNNGFTNGISAPACVQNATPVGAVNSANSISYNRGNILELLAPGISITAPYVGGGTAGMSGTSMACPHTAGAALLMNQYYRLAYSETITPKQIQDKLFISGSSVYDSSSDRTYARIDLLKAVQPFLNFSTNNPLNDSNSTSNSVLINITSDVNLTNALLEWDYNNGTLINYTMNESDQKNFYYNLTGLGNGTYYYQVYGNDTINTFGVSVLREIEIENAKPNITINVPLNNSYYNSAFNLDIVITDLTLSFSNYSILNSSGDVVQSNSSSEINAATFNWTDYVNISNATFSDGNYSLVVYANDSLNNADTSYINFTIDKTGPGMFGINRTPETVYNNDTVIFRINLTDNNALNTSLLFLESNFSGSWVNYSLTLESGEMYNFSVTGLENLTNQKIISYRFHAYDIAGNVNSTSMYTFTVQNWAPTNVSITSHQNDSVIEVGDIIAFTSTAIDPDDDTLTYYWDFGDGTTSNSQNPTKAYNTTGTYPVSVTASDSYGASSLENISLIINDTLAPTLTITHDTEAHLERDGSLTITATAFDYSELAVLNGFFDNISLPTTASYCSDLNSSARRCIWNISFEDEDVGVHNITINATDNFINQHTNITTSTVTFTSCSDSSENGDETETDCGGSCSACDSGNTGDSPSGGGSSGGSSTSTTATETTDAAEEEIISEPELTAAAEVVAEEPAIDIPEELSSFSQTVTLTPGEPSILQVGNNEQTVFEIVIEAEVEKEITLGIDYFNEKPEEVLELANVYQYLKITTGLTEEELNEVQISFRVPQSWLMEHDYTKKKVSLYHYVDYSWDKLKTKLVTEEGNSLTYQAKAKHFSYFAVSGSKSFDFFNWITGAFSTFLPSQAGGKKYTLLGLFVLIMVLSAVYLILRRKD